MGRVNHLGWEGSNGQSGLNLCMINPKGNSRKIRSCFSTNNTE